MRKRMVLLGLTVFALMILSMTLSMARSWPVNPIFLAPGLREEGAYTMVVPGTYGHLIPILPFPFPRSKDPIPTRNGSDDGTTPTHPGTLSAHPTNPVGMAPPSGGTKIGGGGTSPVGSENMGMPMGNVLSGSIAANHVDNLENDLRDAIRRLNAK